MNAVIQLPKLLSEHEAADYLGVSTITLQRWRKRKKIGCIMVGRKPCYTEQIIRDYLQEVTQCQESKSPTSTHSSSGRDPRTGISSGVSAAKKSGAVRALEVLSRPG
jgi:excisionase family DNA binding protein